jgi:hypothetical protein
MKKMNRKSVLKSLTVATPTGLLALLSMILITGDTSQYGFMAEAITAMVYAIPFGIALAVGNYSYQFFSKRNN